MDNNDWLLKEDLPQKILKGFCGDISMNMSFAMAAKVQIQFFQRRIVFSFFDVKSVVLGGLLLQSRPVFRLVLAVGRLELNLCSLSCTHQSSHLFQICAFPDL